MLINVVQSESLHFAGYLLSINEIDINDDSNAPIKVFYQAIYSRDEQFTLFVLGHERMYKCYSLYISIMMKVIRDSRLTLLYITWYKIIDAMINFW